MHHRPQAIVEDGLDLGDVVLQSADGRTVLFGCHGQSSPDHHHPTPAGG
jgi:hypothetical protein